MIVFLVLLSIKTIYVLPITLFVIYRLRHRVSLMLCLILVGLICIRWYMIEYREVDASYKGEVIVYEVTTYDTYDRVILKTKKTKYFIYTQPEKYTCGDILFVSGKIEPLANATVPFGFSPKLYYVSHGITGKLNLEEIRYVDHQWTLRSPRQIIKQSFSRYPLPHLFYTMMFGDKLTLDDRHVYLELGILHLLSVSGIHLYAVFMFIKKLCHHLDVKMSFQHIIMLSFYGVMCYLHDFDLGITRLLMIALLSRFNAYFDLRRSRLEIIHVVFLLMLLFQTELIYRSSFLMLYLILVSLELLEPLYRKHHGIMRRWIMGMIVAVVLIPFQSSFSLLGVLSLPLMAFPLAFTYMFGALMTFIVPSFHTVYAEMVMVFEMFLTFLSKRTMNLVYGRYEDIIMVLFYMAIIFFLTSKTIYRKTICLLGLCLICIIPWLMRQHQTSITFLDVGQGDATILKTPHCIAVIDAYRGTAQYLQNQGIVAIDYLILTHSDTDHILEASEIIKQFSVKHLMISAEDHGYPLYHQKTKKVKSGDSIPCGKVNLKILAPIGPSSSENNASIVLQFTMHQEIFLLTGDIEFETETKLVETYQHQLKSDVLKVAHHGSRTSSSSLFLFYVKPKIVLISVGRSNRYGFPHLEVIERFKSINALIYRTDTQGTITYTPSKKKSKWQMCLPF